MPEIDTTQKLPIQDQNRKKSQNSSIWQNISCMIKEGSWPRKIIFGNFLNKFWEFSAEFI